MLIKPHTLSHWINSFYGYGSWQAPIWFVAHEESGGDLPEEVAEKLDYFYDAHKTANSATLCDVRSVYKKMRMWWEGPKAELFKNRYEYRFGTQAALNKVWANLIAFSFGFRGIELPDVLAYQQRTFADHTSSEALLRLFPLPGANHHGWNYNWLTLPEEFNFLKSRTLYQDYIYPTRIRNILTAIQEYKPAVVLMYGMSNINQLKKSVCDFYPNAKFSLVKSVKLKIPQHHRAQLNDTLILITTQIPALRHNRVETGFNWFEFSTSLRG